MTRCMGCMEQMPDHEQICPKCGYDKNAAVQEAYYLLPGTAVGEKYIVGRVLGYGGFGVTYIGWDKMLNRRVAIKEYLPSNLATRSYGTQRISVYSGEAGEQYHKGLERFMSEARRLAKFHHVPEIVDIYDCCLDNNSGYIVMEYLEGETVKQILQYVEKMPEDKALKIIRSVLAGLSMVHKEGIIHRDIAPDNIFITKKDEVKILDFGAARHESAGQSKTLSVILKPGYAPQEQYSSNSEQGSWTDMYAIGATFYRMITGKTPQESLERAVEDHLLPPSQLGIQIDPAVEHAVLSSLQVKKERRIQNAEQFLDALNGKGKPVPKPQPVFNKNWIKYIAGVVCAAVCISIAFFVKSSASGSPVDNSDSGAVLTENECFVPNIMGMDIEEAEKLLKEKQLNVVISGMNYSDSIEKDRILSQNPKDGEKAEPDQTVYVIMSGGNEEVMMPDLRGLTYDEAADLIKAQNLILAEDEIGQEYSEFVEKGRITAQSIESKERIGVETEVSFTISRGRISEETAVLKVPNLVGATYDEAVKRLARLKEKEGFTYTIGETQKKNNVKVKKNRIASQSPKAGTRVRSDEPIHLVISKGPKIVQVPRLVNLSQEKAVKQLQKKGLKAKVETSHSSSVAAGQVISQGKKPDARIAQGSEVSIVVSLGKAPAVPSSNTGGSTSNNSSANNNPAGGGTSNGNSAGGGTSNGNSAGGGTSNGSSAGGGTSNNNSSGRPTPPAGGSNGDDADISITPDGTITVFE